MSISQQIAEIDEGLEQAKEFIQMGESLERLEKNKDWKRVIASGFFEKEANRVVMLRADPNVQGDEEQRQVDNIITSIGGLNFFLHTVRQMSFMASEGTREAEGTREELLREQIAGNV